MEWRLTTVGAGRPWPPSRTDSLRTPRDYKLPHTDSGQNSLEYWDYTVELEMLKGPEGKHQHSHGVSVTSYEQQRGVCAGPRANPLCPAAQCDSTLTQSYYEFVQTSCRAAVCLKGWSFIHSRGVARPGVDHIA
ncbi:hypothetical protein E2C01_082405 [Portunus trituberculatus]|uniref:Uncharacterized protein n=1 Tax=Portunus trituberculatus TaxID=210409 RepID=A0A5B7IS95_PORTR|nr:hypothetical protein [Portunus trituberculatus]